MSIFGMSDDGTNQAQFIKNLKLVKDNHSRSGYSAQPIHFEVHRYGYVIGVNLTPDETREFARKLGNIANEADTKIAEALKIKAPEGVERVRDRYGNIWREDEGTWTSRPRGSMTFDSFDQLVRSIYGPVRPEVITYGEEISA